MRIACVGLLTLCLLDTHCRAAFTDFSDYTQSVTFNDGDVFQSHGLSFKAIELQSLSSATRIAANLQGNPLFTFLMAGAGVEFLIPAGTQEIAFRYDNGGGRIISINGEEPLMTGGASLSVLDGTSVAGVEINTQVTFQSPFGGDFSHESGTITLRGPISTFAIAGVEMFIDDVSVVVPEPSSLALILSSVACSLRGRRFRG